VASEVKICGINTADSFDATVEAGADWLGFVFVGASPRAVTPGEAALIAARGAGGPGRVGLFVEPTDEDLGRTLAALTLDAVQLYTSPERAAEVRRRYGVPVWLAVGVAEPADLPREAPPGVDRLLLDAKPAAGAALPGGNAHPFDWAMLRGWTAPLPWMLAGGLTPAVVPDAIRLSGAPGVDVSSGVERGRGVKDPALIRAFIRAARETDGSARAG
jgi:phosphoribosylanthranilate isomerase